MESPQQESDTTETEIPDTEANSEEPALPETTEQEIPMRLRTRIIQQK